MKQRLRLAVLAFPVLMFSTDVHAGPLTITLDTSPLSGTQTLVFGLTNFDASSNTVLLSDFAFDGGSAVAASADCTLGGSFSGVGCSGDLTTGVTLEDLDPTAAFFVQQFEAGTSLSFVLDATNNFTGPVPDQFADRYIESRLCPTVTNVTINVAAVNSFLGLGEVANPLAAHTSYDADQRVGALIARGAGHPNVAPIVAERCTFRATDESLMR